MNSFSPARTMFSFHARTYFFDLMNLLGSEAYHGEIECIQIRTWTGGLWYIKNESFFRYLAIHIEAIKHLQTY